jgi:integrase
MFQKAGADSGIGKVGTHSLRHSYRSWLDALGTATAVQQKLMRRSHNAQHLRTILFLIVLELPRR